MKAVENLTFNTRSVPLETRSQSNFSGLNIKYVLAAAGNVRLTSSSLHLMNLVWHTVLLYISWIHKTLHRSLYYVCLLSCLLAQIASQPITWQQLISFRSLSSRWLAVVGTGEERGSDFERGRIVGTRQADLSLLTYRKFSRTTNSQIHRVLFLKKTQ